MVNSSRRRLEGIKWKGKRSERTMRSIRVRQHGTLKILGVWQGNTNDNEDHQVKQDGTLKVLDEIGWGWLEVEGNRDIQPVRHTLLLLLE
jgi:hypothetical protein